MKISKKGKSAYARFVDGGEISLLREKNGIFRYTHTGLFCTVGC